MFCGKKSSAKQIMLHKLHAIFMHEDGPPELEGQYDGLQSPYDGLPGLENMDDGPPGG